jgi:hypothetical protein
MTSLHEDSDRGIDRRSDDAQPRVERPKFLFRLFFLDTRQYPPFISENDLEIELFVQEVAFNRNISALKFGDAWPRAASAKMDAQTLTTVDLQSAEEIAPESSLCDSFFDLAGRLFFHYNIPCIEGNPLPAVPHVSTF